MAQINLQETDAPVTVGTNTIAGIDPVTGSNSTFIATGDNGDLIVNSGHIIIPRGIKLIVRRLTLTGGVFDLQNGTLEHTDDTPAGDNGNIGSGAIFRARGGILSFTGSFIANHTVNSILIRSQNNTLPVIDIAPPASGGPGLTVIKNNSGTGDPGLNITGFTPTITYNSVVYNSQINGLVGIDVWFNLPPDIPQINIDYSRLGQRTDRSNLYRYRFGAPQTNNLRTAFISGNVPLAEIFRPNRAVQGATSTSSNYNIIFIEGRGVGSDGSLTDTIQISGSAGNDGGGSGRNTANQNEIEITQAWQPEMLTGLGVRVSDGKVYFPAADTSATQWSPRAGYVVNDVVLFNNIQYTCTADVPVSTTDNDDPATATSSWTSNGRRIKMYRVPSSAYDPYTALTVATSGEIINPDGYLVVDGGTVINGVEQDTRELTYTDRSSNQDFTLKTYTHNIGSNNYLYAIERTVATRDAAREAGRPTITHRVVCNTDVQIQGRSENDASALSDPINMNQAYQKWKSDIYRSTLPIQYSQIFTQTANGFTTGIPIDLANAETEITTSGSSITNLNADPAVSFDTSTGNGTITEVITTDTLSTPDQNTEGYDFTGTVVTLSPVTYTDVEITANTRILGTGTVTLSNDGDNISSITSPEINQTSLIIVTTDSNVTATNSRLSLQTIVAVRGTVTATGITCTAGTSEFDGTDVDATGAASSFQELVIEGPESISQDFGDLVIADDFRVRGGNPNYTSLAVTSDLEVSAGTPSGTGANTVGARFIQSGGTLTLGGSFNPGSTSSISGGRLEAANHDVSLQQSIINNYTINNGGDIGIGLTAASTGLSLIGTRASNPDISGSITVTNLNISQGNATVNVNLIVNPTWNGNISTNAQRITGGSGTVAGTISYTRSRTFVDTTLTDNADFPSDTTRGNNIALSNLGGTYSVSRSVLANVNEYLVFESIPDGATITVLNPGSGNLFVLGRTTRTTGAPTPLGFIASDGSVQGSTGTVDTSADEVLTEPAAPAPARQETNFVINLANQPSDAQYVLWQTTTRTPGLTTATDPMDRGDEVNFGSIIDNRIPINQGVINDGDTPRTYVLGVTHRFRTPTFYTRTVIPNTTTTDMPTAMADTWDVPAVNDETTAIATSAILRTAGTGQNVHNGVMVEPRLSDSTRDTGLTTGLIKFDISGFAHTNYPSEQEVQRTFAEVRHSQLYLRVLSLWHTRISSSFVNNGAVTRNPFRLTNQADVDMLNGHYALIDTDTSNQLLPGVEDTLPIGVSGALADFTRRVGANDDETRQLRINLTTRNAGTDSQEVKGIPRIPVAASAEEVTNTGNNVISSVNQHVTALNIATS